jgi:microcystin-dependent protein
MSQPYVGEIRMFGGNFAPQGWAFCNGQLVSIAQNQTLFQLIGTTYGGDGINTYGLPNMQGCLPLHQGSSYVQGGLYGSASMTLAASNLPVHSHPLTASNAPGTTRNPTSAALADVGRAHSIYAATLVATVMNVASGGPAGGGNPISKVQPYQALSFIISLFGIFPSQS